jgi:PAS domain S-box-containing protein
MAHEKAGIKGSPMGIDEDNREFTAADDLRRHAEERLQAKTAELRPPRTEEETRRLVHEFEVYRIELEMQNAELRQSRDELEAALEKYTDLFDFAPLGYFTLDGEGEIRAVNLTGAGLLGVERSRLIGRRLGQFVAAADRPAFTVFLEKVFTRPAKQACEVALLEEGNHQLFVQIEAVATASGQECRAAIIDISVRKQLEGKLDILYADLSAHAAQLEEANIELEAFNFSVSHDLRTPLTAINGYCQVIQQLCGAGLDDNCKEYLREMFEGTLRMSRLIDTLLNFSRVTRVEMRRDKVDLSKMAEDVALRLKMTEPERRVTFRIATGIMADGDQGLLRVVLNNLLGNAWKYTGKREETVIEFGVTAVDGKPACFIRDNGPGFEMEHAGKLFMPFQRLPGTDVDGHGIGLATVERIVKRHGGKVWAEGEPGKGATFFFTLE